jgi:succinyl-CoA synthetase beta subunit
MSILINKDTRVITQGITGKTGQFHTKMCREYANGRDCFVAGVNPKKAGEDFEGIPIFGTVRDAKAKTGATVSVIYVPPPFAAAAIDEVRDWAKKLLGMKLVTHQTGPEGRIVHRLLIEEGADIRKEYYLAIVVDRGLQRAVMMGSSEGGVNIEEVAEKTPDKIHKVAIDPFTGLKDAEAELLAHKIGIPSELVPQARELFKGIYKVFDETDASLAEVNPLITTGDGRVVALDAKLNFDSNALFRHEDVVAMRDLDEEDPAEVEASKFDLNYIQLDGDIGCLVNGAGLAMATMDTIKLYGGSPANFLDVGGGATAEKVTEAFKIMLKNPKLKAILVNIFGGIMKCDVIATGVVTAARQVSLKVPLVVRLEGTNVDLGKKILAESGLPIISATNMGEAAEKVVAAAAKGK